MTKYKFACVRQDQNFGFYVFFSNEREKPSVMHHEIRQYFPAKNYKSLEDAREKAIEFAKKWTKPKQGKVWIQR